jgi:hypothetical protein
VSGSFKGIAGGVLLFIIGSILLFWNEGNFVKTKKSLQEAEDVLVRVTDVSTVDSELNGKLIHASAFADTKETLTDELFGVSEKAISISRKVEYYQYVEKSSSQTRDRVGGGQETVTTYTYEKEWTSSPVNSLKFNDSEYRSANFTLTTIEAKKQQAKEVSFGGYRLPDFIISSISGNIPAEVRLTPDELTEWQNTITRNLTQPGVATKQFVHVNGNVVYFGLSTSPPAIGDVRVTLTKIKPADISIIAKVNGSTFESYTASNGKTVSAVSMGTVSAESMFADQHSLNQIWTWILRLLGVFLVIWGLKLMFGILPAVFKVIPFLGNIVDAGVGIVCTIIGGAWSLIIIAISMLWYRPVIGIILLVIAIAGIWLLKKKTKNG